MSEPTQYRSLYDLPQLAGLCSVADAASAQWSVDASVKRLKRLHYLLKRMSEAFVERIAAEPIYELKLLFSHHAYICAEQVDALRRRVSEMREPPLGLEQVPHQGLQRLVDELTATPQTKEFLVGSYVVLLTRLLEAVADLKRDAHPLADAPTVRLAKLMEFELTEILEVGLAASDALPEKKVESDPAWQEYLEQCIAAAGGIAGSGEMTESLPEAQYADQYAYASAPRRDERFQDPFNAGVNPEAFLYDEQFSAQDKTLMMYYKRIRELDVPEMMSSILVELRDQEPWGFHFEMLRQLWDEARHAMMGEVGFASLGLDWTKIPINFTWSRNLNCQLDARQRHGVLFFIEQGLMPRSGKRYEWEVALQSGSPLSGLFQDFDWADEVLHAQIGRRWYVPRFDSLQDALQYGDRCWSQVLSHWQDYRDRGLTEHRNWWPELYQQACQHWGKVPDKAALAFNQTYETQRADLAQIDTTEPT